MGRRQKFDIMKYNLDKTQFTLTLCHHGGYMVEFIMRTGDRYKALITDMELIDSVHKVDYPSQNALRCLANAVKLFGSRCS